LSPEQRRVLGALLTDVRRGNLAMAGVVADYLDDAGQAKLAGKVRGVWLKWQAMIDSWRRYYHNKGKVRLHGFAYYILPWHRWCRRRVLALCGRRQSWIGPGALLRLNPAVPTPWPADDVS
jgi:hypothetical protein